MAEGIVLLRWVSEAPADRGALWSAYSLVQDWRLAKSSGDAGLLARNEARPELDQFLTDKARRSIASGAPLPEDPYVTAWYKGSLRDLFRAIDPRLYDSVYADFAEYHHWSPRGLAPAIKRQGTILGHFPMQSRESAQCLAVAFHSLYDVLSDANAYLELGIVDELAEVLKRHPVHPEIAAAAGG